MSPETMLMIYSLLRQQKEREQPVPSDVEVAHRLHIL
jgi:hypothetical protein